MVKLCKMYFLNAIDSLHRAYFAHWFGFSWVDVLSLKEMIQSFLQ